MRRLLSAAIVLLLSGCFTLGPEYSPPDVAVQTDWMEPEDPLISSDPAKDPRWWRVAFNDPTIDKLVDTALLQNLTLRSAALRVLQARQQLAIAIGNQYPQLQQGAGAAAKQRQRGVTVEEYNLGLNASWELDFWGRYRLAVESASAVLDSSVAVYDGALISLIAQVAQSYIALRTFEKRIAVAQFNVALQTESLRIAQAKLDSGDVSELDVNQAQSLLNNTRASVFNLRGSLQITRNSLAILLGALPDELTNMLGGEPSDSAATPAPGIPEVSAPAALGMPQQLIRRRPDIRIAERQLAAQSAQIGVATADLYPSFSIGGSIGTAAADTDELFESGNKTWSLLGAFQWNLFNYGRLKSNVRLQDARFQQLLEDYRNVVLQAQADVENSIVSYLRAHDQLGAYRLAAEAAERAVEIATTQYKQGEIEFITLIVTLQSATQQEDFLAATQGAVATNLVQVYRALGGGWEFREATTPDELLPEATRDEMIERTRYWKPVLQ